MDQEDVMMENGKRRKRRQLSPEEKWEVFLEVCSQQLSQADAARKWNVDVSTVIRIRRLAKDAALAAFAASKPECVARKQSGSSRIEPRNERPPEHRTHPRSPGEEERFEGVARRHGRRRNPARMTPRSSLRTPTNRARHHAQHWVRKVGRSIANSETPHAASSSATSPTSSTAA